MLLTGWWRACRDGWFAWVREERHGRGPRKSPGLCRAVRGSGRGGEWRSGIDRGQPTGLAAYVVVEALAAEQIALGHDVVVDAVNAVEPARDEWRQLAERTGSLLRFIEVRCSDEREHRRRLETRDRGLGDFREPTWESVQERQSGFSEWNDERLVLDSMLAREDNLRAALDYLAGARR